MSKIGLILLLSVAMTVCLAQRNEETCKSREIQRQFDQLANKTMPDLADESIQKLERSLSDLYDKVETIIKPIEAKQEQLEAENGKILEKIEAENGKILEALAAATPQPESPRPTLTEYTQLINQTVTDIVEKLMDAQFEKVKALIKNSNMLGISSGHPASSCKEIFEQNKESRSEYYWVKASNGYPVRVFCDMTRTCEGVTGGWMRVAELDTTKPSYQCPYPLSSNTEHGKNLCARTDPAGGCLEVHYQTNSVPYNEVCGRVIGYQFASPDASRSYAGAGYIDGVSITHGRPRQHIWSFLAALDEYDHYPRSKCSCMLNGIPPPSFIGDDYFCDTASRGHWQHKFYPDDPLWDGSGCGQNNNCCTFRNPPWFYKRLGASTSNNIDMRVCTDQALGNEDVLLEKVDIFVR